MPQLTWTDDRLDLLKRGFAAGLSCRQLAAEIGVTRNAVIGKLSRLNLTRKNGEEPRRIRKKPDPSRVRLAAVGGSRTTARGQYEILTAHFGEPRAPLPVVDPSRHCSLLELEESRCRWPISTPGAEDFCFCGNTPVDGLPYCAGHSRMAYRARAARG